MDEKEQLKMLLRKYLEVRVDTDVDWDGDTKVQVTIFFEGEEIDSSFSYVYKQKGDD